MANFVVFTFLIFQIFQFSKSTFVSLPNLGNVEGYTKSSYNGRTIYSFEGVPYAQPPTNELRFKEALPVKPWKGTWKAKTIYRCMQYNQYTRPGRDYVVGDEDCLYLNIHTPNLTQNALLDVIVYIHGGSFMFNFAGLYQPDFLLDKDVVLVTINYRLGPLGFLSTESDVVPGNNGLKDQTLALKFVQNHIKNFGGNPNSVTIWGTSAGGASVHYHFLTPKSQNLFNKGISQSGTALVPWALMEKPLEKTQRIANNLGCPSNNTEEMIECLKNRPGRQVVSSVKIFQPWLYLPFSPFAPVVDFWASDPVFPDHPYKLLKKGKVFDVPWLVGFTNSEGLYPAEEFYEHLEVVDENWNTIVPLILDYNYTVPENIDEVSQKIREHFLAKDKLSKNTFKKFLPLLSERIFLNGINEGATLHSVATNSSVFCYQFAYRGQNSWFKFRDDKGKDFGAAHADDVAYVMKLRALNTTTNLDDLNMTKLFLNLIVSFVQNSEPQIGVDWKPLEKQIGNKLSYLQINSANNVVFKNTVFTNQDFWDSLPIKENQKLFQENEL